MSSLFPAVQIALAWLDGGAPNSSHLIMKQPTDWAASKISAGSQEWNSHSRRGWSKGARCAVRPGRRWGPRQDRKLEASGQREAEGGKREALTQPGSDQGCCLGCQRFWLGSRSSQRKERQGHSKLLGMTTSGIPLLETKTRAIRNPKISKCRPASAGPNVERRKSQPLGCFPPTPTLFQGPRYLVI